MDDLNNHQLILLATLVSFVTSIATGIITVSLLQQAPATVTQTVNRVVERTIERVVTGTSTPEVPRTITQEVTKEVTVYAKEDDLLVSAVEKNQPRVALIYPVTSTATGTKQLGTGIVVSRDGVIATTLSTIAPDGTLAERYSVVVGERELTAKPIELKGVAKDIALLRIVDLQEKEMLDAVVFGSKVDPKIGQTVVVLGGGDGISIFKTVLTRLIYESGASTTSPKILSGLEVTPKIPEGFTGGLVANLDGQTVGMVVWSSEGGKYIILPSARILEAISVLSAAQGKNQGKNENDTQSPTQTAKAEHRSATNFDRNRKLL
jgi:hypothetical protein